MSQIKIVRHFVGQKESGAFYENLVLVTLATHGKLHFLEIRRYGEAKNFDGGGNLKVLRHSNFDAAHSSFLKNKSEKADRFKDPYKLLDSKDRRIENFIKANSFIDFAAFKAWCQIHIGAKAVDQVNAWLTNIGAAEGDEDASIPARVTEPEPEIDRGPDWGAWA